MKTLIENVICLSNASLDIFPNNSLTKFTHRLPKPIKVPAGLKPFVVLQEFVLTNYPTETAPQVGFLKVHLEQIDPIAGPEVSDRRLLATLPNKSGRISWIRPEYPVLCPLADTDQIEELSFLVTDELNKQLQLKAGATTVIHLIFVMTNAQKSFTMSVGPDTSKHLFDDNSLATFSVEMPETLQLDENWEVALLSAQAGSSVVMEDSRLKFVLHTKKQMKEKEFVPGFGAHPDDKILIVSMRGKEKMSDSHLVDKVLKPWLEEFGFIVSFNPEDGGIKVRRKRPSEYVIEMINTRNLDEDEDDVDEENKIPDTLNAIISLELCPNACKVLRMEQTGPEGKLVNLIYTKMTELYIRDPMDDYGITYSSESRYQTTTNHHLAIYCDLVQYSIIGNEIAPIMAVIPTKKLNLFDAEKEAFYAIKNPVFRGINPNVRKTFNVALRSLDGSVPPLIHDAHDFVNDKHPIKLTFVFRRVEQ